LGKRRGWVCWIWMKVLNWEMILRWRN